MESHNRDSESLLACLMPVLSKAAARELEVLQQMYKLFPGRTTPEILKQVRALDELLSQFPELTLAEMAKAVRAHIDSQRNAPAAVISRVRAKMQNASDESVEEIEQSLRKMTTTELKKVGKSFDLELAGNKAALVESITVWINSGGTIRPKTKAELAANAVQHYVSQAKPLMHNIDSAAADNYSSVGLRTRGGGRRITVDGGSVAVSRNSRRLRSSSFSSRSRTDVYAGSA